MKVRMQPGHLRLRVSESELERLSRGDALQLDLAHGHATLFALDVRLHATPPGGDGGFGLEFDRDASRWRLSLCAAAVADHAATLPRRDGVVFAPASWRADAGPALSVLFEVDVRDSARVRRESAGGRTDTGRDAPPAG